MLVSRALKKTGDEEDVDEFIDSEDDDTCYDSDEDSAPSDEPRVQVSPQKAWFGF